ncbi:MAG: M23 family metallopeptidase [Alkalispirochaeta sp.]
MAVPRAVVDVPATVLQGEALTVRISSATIKGTTAELVLADGSRHSSSAWRVAVYAHAHAHSDRSAWIALLGVPSTAAVGEAELVVRFTGGDEGASRDAPQRRFSVRVQEGRFRSERIALNRGMTDLRTTDDPRRAEQSQTLWKLIHRVDLDTRVHSGRFRLPVADFRETSYFGDRREFGYADGASAQAIHNGMDLAAPTGTPVIAPASGRVVMAEDRIITGLSVVLEHLPGVFSLYYHLDSMDVVPGDVVSAGAPLGTVGSTGLSTGPHLHWELRIAGVAVDPRTYLTEPLVDTAMLVRSLSLIP